MSKRLNRKQLQKMLLREFKMIGMAPMGGMGHMQSIAKDDFHVGSHKHGCDACGMSPCGCDEYEEGPEMSMTHSMHASHKGSVSREDCCAAVLCLVECCSCPETRRMLEDVCHQLMNKSS